MKRRRNSRTVDTEELAARLERIQIECHYLGMPAAPQLLELCVMEVKARKRSGLQAHLACEGAQD